MNRLITPRDWQAEALKRAADDSADTATAMQALVDAKRFGMLADCIDTLTHELAHALKRIERHEDQYPELADY